MSMTTLAHLQQTITNADPAAVLVSTRVVERVVQEACNLQAVRWVVPHRHSYVVDRHVLFRHVEQEDLTLKSHHLLPAKVVLLARPKSEELNDKATLLLKYWQRLFHANVHLKLEKSRSEGILSDAIILSRVKDIGNTEFEEIRSVLSRDGHVPNERDDVAVYIEFVAIFLELQYFSPQLLPVFFPTLRDIPAIGRLISDDIDADELFKRTKLDGAGNGAQKNQNKETESNEFFWKLIRNAEKAASSGNHVRSAILRIRAARVAPADLSAGTTVSAESELKKLTERLRPPLDLSEEQAGQLLAHLIKLLDKADQGQRPVEAAILYELQQVCIDHEEEIYTLGPVEWALSIGKRPIRRPLPSQRAVRIIRQLRAAIDRLTIARLLEDDRNNITDLLHGSLKKSESRMRDDYEPILVAAMEDVGLRPQNPLEATAFHKMIEEFLDRMLKEGFVTFGELRDIISRNQLKMPDLAKPQDFIRGDPLLRLDRRLAVVLDGVYRSSEIYMRWLERLTSLNFGTKLGRFITRYVTLPFGGAFILVELLTIIIEHLLPGDFRAPQVASVVGVSASPSGFGPLHAVTLFVPEQSTVKATSEMFSFPSTGFWTLGAFIGVLFLCLLHSRAFRQRINETGTAAWMLMRTLFYDIPAWVVSVPAFRKIIASWPAQLAYWYVIKPGLYTAVVCLFFFGLITTPLHAGVLFFIVLVLLNTRTGLALTEGLYRGFIDLIKLIRQGLLGALFSLIVAVFKQVTHMVEYVLFKVDELLRFRGSESPPAFAIRIVLSLLWFPIAFVIRFYAIVLIEPMLNPLKLPISTAAAKILYPLTSVFFLSLSASLEPFMGAVLAYAFAWVNWTLFPDAFGFLIWETKENWSLYRANRSTHIRPVPVGGHGETVRGLLQPGFHSGTIPKLFTRWRYAEQAALKTGNYRTARGCQKSLLEVKEDVHKFVTRELISLVHQSAGWEHNPLHVENVDLASNRIEFELGNADHPGPNLTIHWEYRSQWLIAGIRDIGWLPNLDDEPRCALLAGIVYLYKLAGVQLIHEQIRNALPGTDRTYDFSRNALIVRSNQAVRDTAIYSLNALQDRISAKAADGTLSATNPEIETRQILFSETHLTWEQLVQTWTEQGGAYRGLLVASQCWLPAIEKLGKPATEDIGISQPQPSETAEGELQSVTDSK